MSPVCPSLNAYEGVCRREDGDMRTSSAIFTAVAATIAGLLGVGMLTASGLSWVDSGFSVLEYADSDDSERAIGMTMGAVGVGVWLVLSLALVRSTLAGSRRGGRIAVRLVLGAGAMLVLGFFVVALVPVHTSIS